LRDRGTTVLTYCVDILARIGAVQAAWTRPARVLDRHARTCVTGAKPEQQDERTKEITAVGRLL